MNSRPVGGQDLTKPKQKSWTNANKKIDDQTTAENKHKAF